MSSPSVYLSASSQENNLGIDGVSEEARMNVLVRDVGNILTSRGVTVYYNEPAWSLSKIVNDSNAKKPDLHIAVHTNAGGGTGTETWCYGISGTNSAAFGSKLQAALVGTLELRDRGIKDSSVPGFRWAEVVNTNATSVLTELFFHDNAEDIERYNQRYQRVVASMADIISEWFNLSTPNRVQILAGGVNIDAVIIDNRSYAPVRQLAEALGHTVDWIESTRTVVVK
jgi:N-acetylmuramoyl-L-alanine amidase